MIDAVEWLDDEIVRVDGVEFVCRTTDRIRSSPARFFLAKRPDLVRRYGSLLTSHAPRTLVELGVFQGGSVAFAALAGRPTKLVAFERSTERVDALDTFIDDHDLSATVRVHYGVDQGDPGALCKHLDDARLGSSGAIDLVVDDASHLVASTRSSFETIFPFLRPGGLYVIEDWAWAHVGFGLHLPDELPLSAFVFEAMFGAAGRPDVIGRVDIDRDWAVISRGPADLPTDGSFKIRDLCNGRSLDMLPPDTTPAGRQT
jgi:hypothetical protein